MNHLCENCHRFIQNVEILNGKKYNICSLQELGEINEKMTEYNLGFYKSLDQYVRSKCGMENIREIQRSKVMFLDPIRKIPHNCIYKFEREMIK